jgi:hypothetical protein
VGTISSEGFAASKGIPDISLIICICIVFRTTLPQNAKKKKKKDSFEFLLKKVNKILIIKIMVMEYWWTKKKQRHCRTIEMEKQLRIAQMNLRHSEPKKINK